MSMGWAVVTGGAKRLGKAIALELARAGYDLVIHFNTSQADADRTVAEIGGLGRQAWAISADLRDPAAIDGLFAAIKRRCGTLRVLVNSAADFPRNRVGSITVEDWDAVMDLNLRAPFFCAQHAAGLMEAGGVIVNLADVGGEIPWPSYVPYGVSKAGILMLTKSLAVALAPGIRVGGVAPGAALMPDDWAGGEPIARVPLARVGTAEDIAQAVRFIVEAPYLTGETIFVDGGRRWG
ncbi:MAG TPA: SDR family oxidoreductase [Herpetosiphonaceae bacterium]|nr:SDR family oxidoreductase [Herpetosiphonaceae bacterium]